MRLMRWSRLLILFVAFWLPISVVVASGMALSMSGPAPQLAAGEGEVCPQHSSGGSSESKSGDCYGCSFCQFACTAMMPIAASANPVHSGWVAAEFVLPVVPLLVPALLQRPPLTRLA